MSALGGTLVMAVAVALLAIAHGVAIWSGAPTHPASTLGTLGLVMTSLAVMTFAAWVLLTATRSSRRYVFRSHRVLASGLALLVIAAACIVSLLARDPFRHVISSGQITAHDLVDVGCILAAVVCSTGAVVALWTAWESYEDERHWGRSLGIDRPPRRR